MATIREMLEEDLAEELAEAGPDSPLVKHLRIQLASLGSIRGPSELAALNSSKNDRYHGAMLNKQNEAPADMDNPQQMAALQDRIDAEIANWDEST